MALLTKLQSDIRIKNEIVMEIRFLPAVLNMEQPPSNMDYETMLQRVYDNLESLKTQKTIKVPGLEIGMIGSKKTHIANFAKVAQALKRQPEHLANFLSTELCTPCALGDESSLNIKGRFRRAQITSVLQKYITGYVLCGSCRNPDTTIIRSDRITYLVCNHCKSRRATSA
jgi:translation initiation factor 2 subunit 2